MGVGKRERKIPWRQLSILAICRLAEPIALTSVLPYLPAMIESFPNPSKPSEPMPQDQVAKWAGLCVSIFSLAQALTGILWGNFSDRYGRKPIILLGLCSTMLTGLLWGFSRTLWLAMLARALQGAGNGNVGIIRTAVAEMVPFRELQPRAFSIMPLVWNIGSIFGPAIGGALANPMHMQPKERIENPSFLQRYPFVLPNLCAAGLFIVGILAGFLFMEETLETVQDRRDYGLILGQKISIATQRHVLKLEDILHLRTSSIETEPLLDHGMTDPTLTTKLPEDEEAANSKPKISRPPPPSYKEVLNKQSILNLIVYTFLAMHSLGYDQLLPIFMHHPPSAPALADAASTGAGGGNPLQFSGGFGLDSGRIGFLFTLYGISGMLTQFLIFPPLARYFGVVNCLRACAILFPIVYFLTPFTALLPNSISRQSVCFVLMVIKGWGSIFAFPCSTILLTNSASSLRILGTLNGIATSISAIGRAAGPAIGGYAFTLGVNAGYIIAPWWLFSAIAILAAIPVFWLEDGEGFGGEDDSDDGEEEEEILEAAGIEGEAEASGKPPAFPSMAKRLREEEEEERAFGRQGGLLSRTTTASSVAIMADTGSAPITPAISRRASAGSGLRRASRTMSMPLGMGRQGISRRYSSNLGQSLGSNGGYGGG